MSAEKTENLSWIDKRFPLSETWRNHLSEYYAPKNLNFWSFFGSLAILTLVIQIVTGVWLAMSYKPDAGLAFASVEYIMRDVDWGWLIRYMHSTGASMFFIVIYLHMFRGLLWGSYRKPRELLWMIGVVIYLVMMATAFFGYLLPWGQMSYWGAQVIVNLFAAVPVVGEDLSVWVRGDFVISDATLNRFFAFHFLLPFLLAGLVFLHIVALHHVGSNNPDGIEIKEGPKGNRWSDKAPADGIPFHPYYTVKDLMGVVVFLAIFGYVMFFNPTMGGLFLEAPNFQPANPMQTPAHIAPVWYFTPFYAMLRAVPPMYGSQFPGVVVMFAAILILFVLPWLDRSPVKSMRYKGPIFKWATGIFVVSFVALAWLGIQPASDFYTLLSQIFTVLYFAYFLLMPIYSSLDKTKPVPERVTS
ncbi:cytochrome b [Allochromatium vinosum]|uniref:Cytochrome b n=1 Tax=Allochromatium vinosum (strain ATCC 17899 / DSM 180 / NBRC 103801 / NCIMB 10441 / D) TaxID=572477 RepID=CYB_ALLVD|nr:cytochrome b N-terminal domain-containing protein [Allochromatium vinosum]O31215.2 RecName: Full=Cytochrome b [Allochromatium vinosum DSM 180]ADC61041.1 Cytochrome b/b6 domain protein [Allochromatium vinosum DSM 180]MBK1655100.1 cytochrome b [Allochromatium vinosum]